MASVLSELQRKRVWESWLSAEIRANYFAELSNRYHHAQRAITWLVLLFSSGAFVTLISNAPPSWSWAAPVLAFLTAALSFLSMVVQTQKSATDSADLHLRWNSLARDYAALWDGMYANDASTRLAALEQRELEASKSGTAFRFNERRMLKWQEHVVRHHVTDSAA
jgi:hypothetical protein